MTMTRATMDMTVTDDGDDDDDDGDDDHDDDGDDDDVDGDGDGDDDDDDGDDRELFSFAGAMPSSSPPRSRPTASSSQRQRQLGAFREHASAARFQQRCGTARGRHALTRFPADGKGVPAGHAPGSAAPLRSATSCDLATGIRGDSSSPGRSAVEGGRCTGSGTNTGGNGS